MIHSTVSWNVAYFLFKPRAIYQVFGWIVTRSNYLQMQINSGREYRGAWSVYGNKEIHPAW